MINRIFSFIIILSFSSFLLSEEVKTVSDKEKNKLGVKQIKEESKSEKELDKIERKKPKELQKRNRIKVKKERLEKIKSKKNFGKRQQIQLLKKQYRSRKLEINNRYRTRIERLKKLGSNSTLVNSNSELIKQLKSELRIELETLEKNIEHKLNGINNS